MEQKAAIRFKEKHIHDEISTLIAFAVSSKTPSKFGGPPFGLKSTKIVPGKSSFAIIMNGFDPSKLSDPSSVTIFPLLVIFLYIRERENR
jgi:hypothetical protein